MHQRWVSSPSTRQISSAVAREIPFREITEPLLSNRSKALPQVLFRLFIENGAQTVTIKPQAEAMVFSESRDFWFALTPVVRPNASELLLVNSAGLCRLQLTPNLS